MKKRFVAMILVAAVVMAFAGCAGNGGASAKDPAETAENAEAAENAENAEAAEAAGTAAKAAEEAAQMTPAGMAGKAASDAANSAERTVTVSASGNVSVTPDMAQITMGVVTEARTAAEAQSKNAETINAVTAKLKELGVEEKSIQTTGYFMNQQYDYDSKTVTGYRVDTSLTVKDQKVENVGAVISACTESGANQFQGIQMTSSDYDKAYEQALADAVQAASSKAQILAEAAGKKIGEVASITEGYQNTYARYSSPNMFVEEAEAAAGDMGVMPGELAVDANVTVTYTLVD